tara:strand:+ start:898 stop:2322 length:1425 start_codon:yes stop_codon:yes gene_type:complete
MNKYCLFVFLILVLGGCKKKINPTSDKAQCTVVFTNVDSTTNLTLVVYSALNAQRFRASRDSMGFATFKIPGINHGMVSIQKPNVSFNNAFVTNGDTVRIEIMSDGKETFFAFEGDKASHYNFSRKCRQAVSKYQKFSGDIILYKASCKRRFQERKSFLKDFVVNNEVSSEFEDYLNTMFKYEYLYELTIPLSKITTEELQSVDKNYFEDTKIADFDDESILNSTMYSIALNSYLGYYITQSYKGFEGGDEFEKHFQTITDQLTGRVREYAYTALIDTYYLNLLPDNIVMLNDYMDTAKSLVKDTAFSKKLEKIHKKLLRLNKPLPDSIKNIGLMGLDDKTTSLGTILAQNKANTIVVDNWASWCWACFMDMENAQEFKDQVVKDGVKWIYISIDQAKDVDKWREKSREKQHLGLMVNQYLVDGNDLNMYNEYFGTIEGIPRYLFFNVKGELTLSEGPRPTDSVAFGKVIGQLK